LLGKSILNPVLTLDYDFADISPILFCGGYRIEPMEVDIPGNIENAKLKKLESRSHDINDENAIIQELGGKKWTAFDDFSNIFAHSDLKNIRIIVQPPLLATTTHQTILSYDDIISILELNISEPSDSLHKSLSNLVNVPDVLTNILTYLEFVEHKKEVIQLMINMGKLHYLVKNCNEYSEPKKEIRFRTVVGMSGKEKTTFARRAYKKSGIYSEVISSDVVDAVEECQKAGRTFQIACNNISETIYSTNNNESLFGKVLLYKALKYHLNFSLDEFIEMLKSNVTLVTILKVILQIEYPLFIININETNELFDSGHGHWLREVLRSLSRVITSRSNRHLNFLFVVLTGTHASELFEAVKSSNVKTEDIFLPLLKFNHAEKVLLELANWDNLELISHLVAYILFKWPVKWSDTIGIKKKHKIEDLEKEEIIFLEENEYQKRIKLPFLTLHEIYSNQNNHKLQSIRILDFLDNAILPNQNEKLTISTQSTPECIAYHNMQNAKFADSFLITEPFILIQDKQLIVSHRKVIESYSATILEKGLVEKEHNKCKNVGEHIFLFVTDSKKRNDETYKKNEILIREEKSKDVLGDLLALRKLHCIEG
ncbi:21232_t:CDS:2, partial [Gigaspora margarita]